MCYFLYYLGNRIGIKKYQVISSGAIDAQIAEEGYTKQLTKFDLLMKSTSAQIERSSGKDKLKKRLNTLKEQKAALATEIEKKFALYLLNEEEERLSQEVDKFNNFAKMQTNKEEGIKDEMKKLLMTLTPEMLHDFFPSPPTSPPTSPP